MFYNYPLISPYAYYVAPAAAIPSSVSEARNNAGQAAAPASVNDAAPYANMNAAPYANMNAAQAAAIPSSVREARNNAGQAAARSSVMDDAYYANMNAAPPAAIPSSVRLGTTLGRKPLLLQSMALLITPT